MSNKEDTDATQELRADWLSHPYTEAWKTPLKMKAAKALKELMAACADTTDPKVAKACAQYTAAATQANWFAGATDGK